MFSKMIESLRQNPKKIVFTEGNDPRILEATARILKEGFLSTILIGNPDEVNAVAKENGFDITGAEIIDPKNYDKFDEMVEKLCELRKSKGMTPEDAVKTLSQANYFGTMLVKMGFADYFLIVWDYVKYAKKNNIYVGPGRGSAGASLIAYCLGITDVDPIKYNLLFERFLNEERVTMPDIDIDFPDDERDKVIEYVGKRYGASRVAHIGTFGTFQVKLAINDTARVYKTKDTHLKQILKILNAELENYKIHQPSLYDIIEKSDQLKQLMDEYEEINKVLSVACKLQGLPRNVSTHAAGIIITKYPLVNYTALDNGLDGIYQTQFEASDLESLGLLKMDFLGQKRG